MTDVEFEDRATATLDALSGQDWMRANGIIDEARRARRAEAELRAALREIQERVAALARETETQQKRISGTWKRS